MLAAAALMFAACAQFDTVNEVPESEPQAIGFDTYAQMTTRAASNSGEDYSWDLNDHHSNFYVWGYKNVSDTYVFNAKEVSYGGSAWSYTGTVYWDKAATDYEFYAAAPATNGVWILNANTDAKNDDYFTTNQLEIKAHNAASHTYQESFKDVTNAVDYMIAEPKKVVVESATLSDPVQLNFIHILSRLNITVSKASTLSSQTVTMNSLEVHNVKNIGSFNENAPISHGTLAGGTYDRWTPTANLATYQALMGEEIAEQPTTPPTEPEYMLQALVMPQLAMYEDNIKLDGTNVSSTSAPYFTISYTINDGINPAETFKATYNLADVFSGTPKKDLYFSEGWQNTLNITITPTEIEFSGNVAIWGEADEDLDIE